MDANCTRILCSKLTRRKKKNRNESRDVDIMAIVHMVNNLNNLSISVDNK